MLRMRLWIGQPLRRGELTTECEADGEASRLRLTEMNSGDVPRRNPEGDADGEEKLEGCLILMALVMLLLGSADLDSSCSSSSRSLALLSAETGDSRLDLERLSDCFCCDIIVKMVANDDGRLDEK